MNKLSFSTLISILSAIIFFLVLTDGKILWPSNIDWLMEGDPAWHHSGWNFFRESPLFQWPPGANEFYGMELSSSIVFSDSIPLLAFFFKFINFCLPETFQYFGIWLLINFILQSFFSWKILSLFTKDKILPIIGSLFFLISPICIMRLSGHYALCAHWLLLAGWYLFFSPQYSNRWWLLLLILASLTHAYLLMMVICIWLGDLLQRWFSKEQTLRTILIMFVKSTICLIFVMWATGYFALGSYAEAGGFGVYRMNLMSLIDPDILWSKLLPDYGGGVGDYEGFNYLGIGIITLIPAATVLLVKDLQFKWTGQLIPLIILSVFFFLFAISNKIAIGSYPLFSYPLPSLFSRFTGLFRSSGRFFWPVYYLIYLLVFYSIFTKTKRTTAIALCIFALLFQTFDSSQAIFHFRKKFTNTPKWTTPLKSPKWAEFATRYNKIIYVCPQNMPPHWMPVCEFAAKNKMSINSGAFARIDTVKRNDAVVRVTNSILNNTLDDECLYIFIHDGLWNQTQSKLKSEDFRGIVDGIRVIAPGLNQTPTLNANAPNIIIDEGFFECPSNSISFVTGGNCRKHLLSGWAIASSSGGTWSVGDSSRMVLKLPECSNEDVKISIEAQAYLTRKHLSQKVDILVNNQKVGELFYDHQTKKKDQSFVIPWSIISEKNGLIFIRFKHIDPKSPAELGPSPDHRKLGLIFTSLKIAYSL